MYLPRPQGSSTTYKCHGSLPSPALRLSGHYKQWSWGCSISKDLLLHVVILSIWFCSIGTMNAICPHSDSLAHPTSYTPALQHLLTYQKQQVISIQPPEVTPRSNGKLRRSQPIIICQVHFHHPHTWRCGLTPRARHHSAAPTLSHRHLDFILYEYKK